MRYFLD